MFRWILQSYQTAFSGLPRSAWLLGLVEFINRSGTMVLFFLALYVTQVLGFSKVQAGQVMSCYGLGSMAGTYLGGRFCDILGAYRVQKLSLFFTAALFLLLSLPHSLIAIMVLTFLTGLASESLMPANLSAMTLICPVKSRTKGYALHRLAANLGISIGPVAGGYLAMANYRFLFWADALTCLASLTLFSLYFRTPGPARANNGHPKPASSLSPWNDPVFVWLLLLTFFVGLIFSQIFGPFSLYLKEVYQLPENQIGQLLAVNTILIVLFEMLLMHWLRNLAPVQAVSLGVVFVGGGFALMPWGSGFFFAALTVAVWTIGEMLTLPMLITLVAGRADENSQGRYQGLFGLAFSFSIIAGPYLGTQIYSTLGASWLWLSCGMLGIMISLGFQVLAIRIRRLPA